MDDKHLKRIEQHLPVPAEDAQGALAMSPDAIPASAAVLYRPEVLEQALALAEKLAKSNLVPKAAVGSAGAVLQLILAGHELGLSPMQAFRGLNVIDGKVGMGADMMVALVMRSPHCRYFRMVATTAELATYTTHRAPDPPVSYTFTIEDARRAGLLDRGKTSNWSAWPAAMCRARASSTLARMVYPDVLFGIDLPEALETTHGVDVVATIAPPPPVAAVGPAPSAHAHERTPGDDDEAPSPVVPRDRLEIALTTRLEAAENKAELDAILADMLRALPAVKDALKPAYNAASARIRGAQ